MAKPSVNSSVRERVMQGKNVRVRPLADAIGVSPSTVYGWIDDKLLEAVEFGGIVTIPATAARPLLSIPDRRREAQAA